jgi:hypothetical protein
VRLRRKAAGFQLEYLLRVDEKDVNIWYGIALFLLQHRFYGACTRRVPGDRVAEDVKLEYEASWWQCCRQVQTVFCFAVDASDVSYAVKGKCS